MIIIGAKGHAKEVLDLFSKKGEITDLYFYDDLTRDLPSLLYNKFPVIRNLEQVKTVFKEDKRFVIGIGNPDSRKNLASLFTDIGGKLTSIISNDAKIGNWNCLIDRGVNIMSGVFVSNDVKVSEGVLLNTGCQIHHDVIIGRYSVISPNATILGRANIGNHTFVGANATILPDVIIGDNVVVGAGAVVIRNVESNNTVAGNPARIINDSKKTVTEN